MALAALLAAAPAAAAQSLPAPSLSVDTTFKPLSGIVETDFPPQGGRDVPEAVATYGDRVYTVGWTGNASTTDANSLDIAVAALGPSGDLDPGFDLDGQLRLSIGAQADIGYGIAVLPDGRLRLAAAVDVDASTTSASYDVVIIGLNANGTPDETFGTNVNGVRLVRLLEGSNSDVPARIEAGPGGRLAIVGARTDGSRDAFVALLEADGSRVTGAQDGFGDAGVKFSGTTSLVDAGVDVAFRPEGGLVMLTFVDASATANDASAVLRAFNLDGTVNNAFGDGGEVVVREPQAALADTVPGGLAVHGGRLWVAGSRGTNNKDAFVARVNADGSGLQFRRFDMRGRLSLPAAQVLSSQAHDLVAVAGAPETLIAVGSVRFPFATDSDWAAAAFNGLDGDLQNAGFGDIVLPADWTGELVSAAADPQGRVTVAGTHLVGSDYSFGNARLLIDAEKACDLAVTVAEPGEIVFRGSSPSALTARVQNVGARACGGTLTVTGPYGMAPVATGVVAPGATFTAAAVPIAYHGTRRTDDVLQIALDAPADSNAANNRAAAHVVFSYCDLAVEPVGRAGAMPTEGTWRFELSLRNRGTATCRVRVGSKPSYPLARGRAVSDAVAVAAPKGARPGRRVAVVLGASAADDVEPGNNAVTVRPAVVGVGDSDLRSWGVRRFTGTARRGAGDLSASQLRPARVDVAVRREGGKRCSWLSSARGTFTKQKRGRDGHCGRPRWVRAEGTTRWELTLRRSLPAGRYVVYSRATIRAGFPEARFSANDRNRVEFSIR